MFKASFFGVLLVLGIELLNSDEIVSNNAGETTVVFLYLLISP